MMKYIVLGNGNEWCTYSWESLIKQGEVKFFPSGYPIKTARPSLWLKYHFHPLLHLPFKSLWYSSFFRNLGINDGEDVAIIFYDWGYPSADFDFLHYLRKKIPGVKLIYLFSNIVKITGATHYRILDQLKSQYDAVFAFDKKDSEQYGFHYSPLMYSPDTDIQPLNEKSDMFYLGQAKDDDRLDTLLQIFETAQSEGLRCDFHIVGVPPEKQRYAEKITYNAKMSYKEALKHIAATRCLVDVIQKDSSGLTIKTCESVVHGKKLITTNRNVVNEKFYTPNNIQVWQSENKITEFLDLPFKAYTDTEKYTFSPKKLFSQIEKL